MSLFPLATFDVIDDAVADSGVLIRKQLARDANGILSAIDAAMPMLDVLRLIHERTLRGECCPVCSLYPHHPNCELVNVVAAQDQLARRSA